jgi:hypothetical protein
MGIHITYHGLSHSIRKWADLLDLDYYTLLARIRRGWPPEKALEAPLRHEGAGPLRHGQTGSKEYRAWRSMIDRCSSPRYHAYHRYGGRGLEVCRRWRESFETFLADVGNAPSPDLSLGRRDNNRGYFPNNVDWQSAKQQASNRARPGRDSRT